MVEYSTSCLKERGIHLARMVMPVCNLSTWEAEPGGLLKPACVT